MSKILIINGHPDPESFCTHLANAYQKGALAANAQTDILHLYQLTFDPVLRFGYRQRTELEPDLVNAQKLIAEANHLVFVYPTWWGVYPALLKGFIDRVFLPKFAFKYRENSLLWDKLLTGKTARIIVTMDTPSWYYRLVYRNIGHRAMKTALLHFCGVKPVKITSFGPIKSSSEKQRAKWVAKVGQLGLKMA